MVSYCHTQRGYWHYCLYALVAVLLAVAWLVRGAPVPMALVFAGTAAVVGVLSLSFHSLTVYDEGDRLAIRYGPLPLLRGAIPYASITAIEPGRTSVLAGWGIHYLPGHGWIYNLWGFDAVKISLGKKVIHLGTDDVENLVAFLRGKTSCS